jgi:replicative superfamily II helicase
VKGIPDIHFQIAKSDFKIVYVAPMKALAAEIVEKMGKRLKFLGVSVREFTGKHPLFT